VRRYSSAPFVTSRVLEMPETRHGRRHAHRFAAGLLTREPPEEPLGEVSGPERVPGSPFAFLLFLVTRH